MEFLNKLRLHKKIYEVMYCSSNDFEKSVQKFLLGKALTVTFEEIRDDNYLSYETNDFVSIRKYFRPKTFSIGATINGSPAAFGSFIIRGGMTRYQMRVIKSDICFVGLYTYPQFRNQNIMKLLMNELYKKACEMNEIRIMSLYVEENNCRAKKLYGDLGFRVIKLIHKWIFNFPYYSI